MGKSNDEVEMSAYYSTPERTYYIQSGDNLQFMVSFSLHNEDKSTTPMNFRVPASTVLEAIGKAIPLARKAYPTAYGKLQSERFLEHVQILAKKIND